MGRWAGRVKRARIGVLAAALSLAAVGASGASRVQRRAPRPLPEPSENEGRGGTYQCKTSHAGYNYYTYVPASYSEDNPAGLHLFFHGQGGHGSAPHFGQWKQHFLEPHNLIGINMQYTDGDNAADTAGKVAAAVEAIRQTMADYSIVPGRGAVASFSGGGLCHSMLFERFRQGQSEYEGIKWPFSHSSLYGSNYWRRPGDPCQMSWYIGVGTEEWGKGQPTLGSSSTARAEDLYGLVLRKGYCPDIRLKIIKGKGHAVAAEDVRASAEGFARSDAVIAPFVRRSVYGEKNLAMAAALVDRGLPGQAVRKLETVMRRSGLSDDVRAKAEGLRAEIDSHAAKMLTTCAALLESDPILAVYYCRAASERLSGLPDSRQLRKDLSRSLRENRGRAATYSLLTPFAKGVGGFFAEGGKLREEHLPLLENVAKIAGDKVLIGVMAAEFLELR